MKNIPSDEDFARAKRHRRDLDRNLDSVNEKVFQHFQVVCPTQSYKVIIIAEEMAEFRAYFFFKQDREIEETARNGIQQNLIDFVYAELERQGRGRREDITVAFEFDSDENVNANYEGDYYLRLR